MHHCTACGTEFVQARDRCSDCDGPIVEGPSPRFSAPAPRKARRQAPPAAPQPVATSLAYDGPRPELPPTGLRHCRGCHAEFVGSMIDCGDCGAPLFPGESPRFDDRDLTSSEAGTGLSEDDFVPLRRINNGWHADMLCSVLADAGIATVMHTARGRRMRAPGMEPMGPAPAENEAVEIQVFPEHLDEAGVILDEAEETQDEEALVQPTDGLGTKCAGADCAPPPTETAMSPLAMLLAGVVLVVGLAAVLLYR